MLAVFSHSCLRAFASVIPFPWRLFLSIALDGQHLLILWSQLRCHPSEKPSLIPLLKAFLWCISFTRSYHPVSFFHIICGLLVCLSAWYILSALCECQLQEGRDLVCLVHGCSSAWSSLWNRGGAQYTSVEWISDWSHAGTVLGVWCSLLLCCIYYPV